MKTELVFAAVALLTGLQAPAWADDMPTAVKPTAAVSATRQLALRVSIPSNVRVDTKRIKADVETLLAQAGIQTFVPKRSEASQEYSLLHVSVTALNTLHLPPGFYHYGIMVQEVRALPAQAKPAATTSPKRISFDSRGTASAETLARLVPATVKELVAKFIRAYKAAPGTGSK